MKYYILDLSAQNSFVSFLVGQGFTVFMVSWKNPDAEDRNMSMEDYRELGVMAAVDAVQAITTAQKSTRSGIASAARYYRLRRRWGATTMNASLTLLATQGDFTESGPLRLFINESQVTLIEDMMAERGTYLRIKWLELLLCSAHVTSFWHPRSATIFWDNAARTSI